MPNGPIIEQRLPDSKTIKTRQPTGLSNKVVHLDVGNQMIANRPQISLQPQTRPRIFLVIPLAFVELLKKISVCDVADFRSQTKTGSKVMTMIQLNAAAKIFLRDQVEAILPQPIKPRIVNEPAFVFTSHPTGNAKQLVTLVIKLTAKTESSIAQVVQVANPFGPLRFLQAQQLIQIPARSDLGSKNTVVVDTESF